MHRRRVLFSIGSSFINIFLLFIIPYRWARGENRYGVKRSQIKSWSELNKI